MHVTIEPDMKARVWAAARAEERTITSWVRRAIREKLDRLERDDG
jgi:hypothetical protein